jgi:hypothetical protein
MNSNNYQEPSRSSGYPQLTLTDICLKAASRQLSSILITEIQRSRSTYILRNKWFRRVNQLFIIQLFIISSLLKNNLLSLILRSAMLSVTAHQVKKLIILCMQHTLRGKLAQLLPVDKQNTQVWLEFHSWCAVTVHHAQSLCIQVCFECDSSDACVTACQLAAVERVFLAVIL